MCVHIRYHSNNVVNSFRYPRTKGNVIIKRLEVGPAYGQWPRRKQNGMMRCTGVVKVAEKFMTTWHKWEKEASGRRANKQDTTNKDESITTEEMAKEENGKEISRTSKKHRNIQHDATTAAEESKTGEMERVARHVPDCCAK